MSDGEKKMPFRYRAALPALIFGAGLWIGSSAIADMTSSAIVYAAAKMRHAADVAIHEMRIASAFAEQEIAAVKRNDPVAFPPPPSNRPSAAPSAPETPSAGPLQLGTLPLAPAPLAPAPLAQAPTLAPPAPTPVERNAAIDLDRNLAPDSFDELMRRQSFGPAMSDPARFGFER
ncbi:MAG: hypothetical protein ING19_08595 [Azospirillum sp.]|nr:hypothetical protein [Azospirillum sp.]